MKWRNNKTNLLWKWGNIYVVLKLILIPLLINFSSFSQTRVIIFLHPECPISQKYLHKIELLADEFKPFDFQLMIPPKGILKKQIEDFRKEYSIKIPIKIDKKSKSIKQLRATITPEAFVLNSKNEVLYSGMIDNWFYDLSKYRPEATEFYLRAALSSIQKNEEIKINKTTAIGCLIATN
jgi:thiol-disulfide isomerase/thioredoxin